MKKLLGLLALSLALITPAFADGIGVHAGCVGPCAGREEAVVGGRVTCYFLINNISTSHRIHFDRIKTVVQHYNSTDTDENILEDGAEGGTLPQLTIAENESAEWVYGVTADAGDYSLLDHQIIGSAAFEGSILGDDGSVTPYTAGYNFVIHALRRLPWRCPQPGAQPAAAFRRHGVEMHELQKLSPEETRAILEAR